jgi:hypothetical protein
MIRCPACNTTNLRGLLSWAGALVGGLTMSTTLSACYGAPCASAGDSDCPDRDYVPTCAMASSQPQIDDVDQDGYCKLQDCNENDKGVNAAARDIPRDGIDQNCDGRDAN